MQDLTPTQTTVLNAASARPRQLALPLPGKLPAGAQAKVVTALLTRGLLAEANAAPGDPLWRDTGRTLILTPKGMEAIGFDQVVIRAVAAKFKAKAIARPDTPATCGADATDARSPTDWTKAADTPATAVEAPAIATDAADSAEVAASNQPRTGTKQAVPIAMLRAPEGASIAEIASATGWQPHTVRGAIAGALKKRLGLVVTSDKHPERGRVYRIAD
ncbi:MAG: DUF3489 domain-containing protein [Paracoccus sp. (in: a-proteobacteria)]|uniref:DUF3489 domain-containing protein n=1 Tax=Paracoccus sp. TaxID=267 RepID=UPI0026E07E74|nr:DUF3489 domain-containing protein [Paracoccus sp. (in: a-proteobacteria)]MDO5623046.1 DUF3489 domain-containing protein [Paracoccus sp. (in: a-proteobacteria)]